MLQLQNIKKEYQVANTSVKALKGINISFRKNEFVSILGPSGCGKTTLLNLIGGLDKATSGDIKISGKSTKNFTDRDWDIYRNHRIGFVFQSYNLIPHQTVLQNVELALTIAGIDKETRAIRAKKALDKVGLSDQYDKKPNQLSGGQSQRVAIARALVNDPEILLADEPTGALDTVTSKQIMDLIKEISKEKLVIMVTHNPELALEYSTRIIRLLDGELTDDTNPFVIKEVDKEQSLSTETQKKVKHAKVKGQEKAKMSFWTAFKLSLQNLISKKRRTIMTALAGSIGIIGVSLVMSLSFGLQGYIDDMQEDMLSGNPITIEQTALDLSLLTNMTTEEKAEVAKQNGYVNVEQMIKSLNERLSSMENIYIQNTISKDYMDYINDLKVAHPEYLAALNYNYGLDISNSIYTSFQVNRDVSTSRVTSLSGISATYTSILEQIPEFANYAKMIGSVEQPFRQAPNAKDYIEKQYNLEYGHVATEKNEIMIVLNKDRQLSDLLLAQLGFYTQEEFINIVYKATNDDRFDSALYDNGLYEYDKLIGKSFTWQPNDTIFTKQTTDGTPFTYAPYANASWENGIELTIVGILEPKDNINYGSLTNGFYYTEALAKEIIKQNHQSEIALYLRENMSDALNGTAMLFRKGTDFSGTILPFDVVQVISGEVITFDYEYTYEGTTHQAKALVGTENQMFSLMNIGGDLSDMPIIISFTNQQLGGHVDVKVNQDGDGNDISWEVIDYDGTGYGLASQISIYPSDLQVKEDILSYLDRWNSDDTITLINGKVILKEAREQITYSDMLSLVMGMMSSLIQIITIALVGFTSLALIVSSVMIGIITYVSVVERIKEIGVIRSLGGRKKDVSNLFIAETFIIGFTSGLIGILITYLLSFIINIIVGSISVVSSIAVFPWYMALIMMTISVGLTLISGLMPSKSAAKKDPVVALRTE